MHKVWVAVDGGVIVQPESARNIVESAIIYGLSSMLHERATITGGAGHGLLLDSHTVPNPGYMTRTACWPRQSLELAGRRSSCWAHDGK